MKKILALLLAMLMLASVYNISFAEESIAHRLWRKMAEVADIDLAQCWEFQGMYTFGETTANGYITLPTEADGKKVAGSISWRIYPDEYEDIIDDYYPMLVALLEELGIYNATESIEEWLFKQEFYSIFAYKDKVSFDTETCSFELFDISIKYDSEHNELYCLLTATQDSQYFSKKEGQ